MFSTEVYKIILLFQLPHEWSELKSSNRFFICDTFGLLYITVIIL